jgi:hypothetical protein
VRVDLKGYFWRETVGVFCGWDDSQWRFDDNHLRCILELLIGSAFHSGFQ